MCFICLLFVTSQSVFCVFSNFVFTAANNYCQAAACECDRAAALCFAWTKHNPEHHNLDKRLCIKWVNQQNTQERTLDFSLKFNFFMIFKQNLIKRSSILWFDFSLNQKQEVRLSVWISTSLCPHVCRASVAEVTAELISPSSHSLLWFILFYQLKEQFTWKYKSSHYLLPPCWWKVRCIWGLKHKIHHKIL